MARTFEKIVEGVDGAEGPIFDRAGRFFIVEPWKGKVLEVLDGGGGGGDGGAKLREHANTGGNPAGLMIDDQDHLWVADMKLGILRISPDGQVQPIVSEYDGQAIRGCNDLVFDGRGNLYFTAPAGSRPGQPPVGQVFFRRPDGEVRCFEQGFAFCNGISVSPDDATLIVAETYTKKLWAYDLTTVREGGEPSGRRLFATVSGEHEGGPDGLDYDIEGNLLSTNWGGGLIEVFNAEGLRVDQIELPFDNPSNLHFGGPDGKSLWITEHTHNGVWRTSWDHRGLLAL